MVICLVVSESGSTNALCSPLVFLLALVSLFLLISVAWMLQSQYLYLQWCGVDQKMATAVIRGVETEDRLIDKIANVLTSSSKRADCRSLLLF